jgi:hypothetical protein
MRGAWRIRVHAPDSVIGKQAGGLAEGRLQAWPMLGYALRANPTYGSQPEAEVGAGFGEQA